MKKWIPLLLALAMTLAACSSGGSSTPSGTASGDAAQDSTTADEGDSPDGSAEYTMTLAFHVADDSVQARAFRVFAEEVKEQSGGRITVNLSSGGALGSQREIVEAVNLGTIEMGMGESGIYANYNNAFGVLTMPFLYDSEEVFFQVMDGEVGGRLEELLYESTDMVMLSWLYGGARDVYSSKELKSLEDLQSLKIRTPESTVFVEGFKALGANPTAIAATEMYTALQQGTVEAMEGSQETAYTYKIYEIAKNCLETGHIYTDVSLVINKKVFESLPEDLQQILIACGESLSQTEREMWGESAGEYRDLMIAEGMVFEPIDTARAKAAVADFYASYIGGDATMQELYDQIIALQ